MSDQKQRRTLAEIAEAIHGMADAICIDGRMVTGAGVHALAAEVEAWAEVYEPSPGVACTNCHHAEKWAHQEPCVDCCQEEIEGWPKWEPKR